MLYLCVFALFRGLVLPFSARASHLQSRKIQGLRLPKAGRFPAQRPAGHGKAFRFFMQRRILQRHSAAFARKALGKALGRVSHRAPCRCRACRPVLCGLYKRLLPLVFFYKARAFYSPKNALNKVACAGLCTT